MLLARLRFLRNFIIGLLIVVVLVIFASGAILLVTHEGRVAVKTSMLLPEVLPDAAEHPLARFTQAPLQEQATFAYPGGQGTGLLVRPGDTSEHGALILFLGINPDLSDATLRRLAVALAREGVVVFLPEPARLLQGEMSSQEVELLVGAFRYLQRSSFVDPERIGFGGFCVGSSLALIAAADPRISQDVRFVNFFGGYYSAESLLSAMITRQIDNEGRYEPWEPNQDALIWFSQQLLGGLPAADRVVLEEVALRAGPPGSAMVLEPTSLSPEGRAVLEVLLNRDPARAAALYESLPQSLKDRFDRLSPSQSLEWLQAKIFVMHDRNDTYVPYSESRALVQALTSYPRKHYTEFELFKHMHPQGGLTGLDALREMFKLYYHLYLVMLEVA